MRSGRLTAVLLAMAVVLVVTVPTLRGLVANRLRPRATLDSRGFPLASTYAAIVAAHPQDAELWQAYAEALWTQLETSECAEGAAQEAVREETIDRAYQKAVELDPNSAAARFSYAVFHLDRMKVARLPDEGVSEGDSGGALIAPQIERLQAARGLLAECARLAPENAAVDYLLAWPYLAQQRNDEAFAALEGARVKSGWSTYQGESARAALALVDETALQRLHKPMQAMSLSFAKANAFGTLLRSLARTLRNLGDQFREKGHHQQAIACYEAVAHAGHLMRVNAHDMMDGFFGAALSGIAVSSGVWAPEDEEARLSADKELRKSELRAPRFAAYLREHGRDDLAAFVLSDLEAAMRWRRDLRAVVKRLMPQLVWDISGGGVLNAAAVCVAGAAVLGVAVLVGLLSLLARYWREPQRQSPWSYRQWLMLLLVLLLPGQIGATAFTRALWLRQEINFPVWSIVALGGMVLGVVAWLVAVLVIALRRRRALAGLQRFSKARSFLRGLRALVCPTLAALILASVLGGWLVEGRMQRASGRHRQMALQGEAQYWGIGSGGAEAQVAQSRRKIRLFSVVEAALELQPTHWVVRVSHSKGRAHISEEVWCLPNGDKYRHFKGPLDRPEYTVMVRHDSDYTWIHDPETNEFFLVAPSSTPEKRLGIEGTGLVDLPQASRHGSGSALRTFLREAQEPFEVKRSTRVFNGEPVAAFIIEGPRAEGDGSIRLTYYLTRDLSRLVRELAEFPAEGRVFVWETWPIEYHVQPPAVLFGLDRVLEYMEEAERERIIGTVYALAEAWRAGDFAEFEKHYDFAAGLEYGVKGKFTAEEIRKLWQGRVGRQKGRWADYQLTVDYGFATAEPPSLALGFWQIYRESPESGGGWILYRQEPSAEPGVTVLARVKVTGHKGQTRELGTQIFLKKIGGEYKVILWRPPFG